LLTTNHLVNVYVNDALVRSMPTSMGKGGYATGVHGEHISFFTPSGTYTVLDKHASVIRTRPRRPAGQRSGRLQGDDPVRDEDQHRRHLPCMSWTARLGRRAKVDTSHGCLNLTATTRSGSRTCRFR